MRIVVLKPLVWGARHMSKSAKVGVCQLAKFLADRKSVCKDEVRDQAISVGKEHAWMTAFSWLYIRQYLVYDIVKGVPFYSLKQGVVWE